MIKNAFLFSGLLFLTDQVFAESLLDTPNQVQTTQEHEKTTASQVESNLDDAAAKAAKAKEEHLKARMAEQNGQNGANNQDLFQGSEHF